VSTAMNWVRKLIVRAIECFDTAPNDRVVSMNDIIVPLDANTKVEGKRARQQISGRSKGISGRAVDLNGDGDIDFIEPPDFFTFWAQELIPATVLIAIIQLASALIFTQLEDMQYHEAFWHCMVTATTVGYGDVSISTQSGRLFAGFHIAVSVSWLAALVGEVAHLQARRSSEVARAELLQKTYTDDEILRLDANGDGVDKLEFVVGMLMILGVELCGEPLRWKDVRPFVLKFQQLDVSNTGKITKADLAAFARQHRETAQRKKFGRPPKTRRRMRRVVSIFQMRPSAKAGAPQSDAAVTCSHAPAVATDQ